MREHSGFLHVSWSVLFDLSLNWMRERERDQSYCGQGGGLWSITGLVLFQTRPTGTQLFSTAGLPPLYGLSPYYDRDLPGWRVITANEGRTIQRVRTILRGVWEKTGLDFFPFIVILEKLSRFKTIECNNEVKLPLGLNKREENKHLRLVKELIRCKQGGGDKAA